MNCMHTNLGSSYTPVIAVCGKFTSHNVVRCEYSLKRCVISNVKIVIESMNCNKKHEFKTSSK
jgi:hypothetical protein